MTRNLSVMSLVLALALTFQARAAERSYQTGAKEAQEMAVELYHNLDRKYLGTLRTVPLSVIREARPILRITEESAPSGSHKVGVVVMSSGFLDLINHVAHAKAIDRSRKGYLEGYLQGWPPDGTAPFVPPLPDIANPEFWTDEMMDMQITYCSQMLSVAVGIKFAHYYLGQYVKYGSRLNVEQDTVQGLCPFLTADEWEAALHAGARNSLDCAYGVDGIVALFDGVEKMPKRPDWTQCFLPQSDLIKVSKLKRYLAKIEKDFFAGRG